MNKEIAETLNKSNSHITKRLRTIGFDAKLEVINDSAANSDDAKNVNEQAEVPCGTGYIQSGTLCSISLV